MQRQFFSGLDHYEPRLPCDATQIRCCRRLLGEDGIEQLFKASIETAVERKAMKTAESERVIVVRTAQEKANAHPVDSRLQRVACQKVVSAAEGISLRQTCEQERRRLRRYAGGYGHARQFKRLRNVLRCPRRPNFDHRGCGPILGLVKQRSPDFFGAQWGCGSRVTS